jgi:hypothetical protein
LATSKWGTLREAIRARTDRRLADVRKCRSHTKLGAGFVPARPFAATDIVADVRAYADP